MIEIQLPIYLEVGKREPKKLPLNLNHYRNAHFQVLNQMKKAFKEAVGSHLKYPKIQQPIQITYVLHLPTRRLTDISNVCSIVDKYFQDALVELGLLEDDNYNHIKKVVFEFGSIDKHNPRADARIEVYQSADYDYTDGN